MNKYLHIGITVLCLVALVARLGVCGHTFAAAAPECVRGMPHTMPMPVSPTPGQSSLPPCCAAHPQPAPAELVVVNLDLPAALLVVSVLDLARPSDLLTAQRTLVAAPILSRLTFHPPLRI